MLKTLCCSLALKKRFRSVFDGLTCFKCPFWRIEDGCLICLYSSLLAFFCWVESVVSCRNGLNKLSSCQLWWLFCRVSRHLSSNPATFQFRPEPLIEWAYTNKGLSQMSGTQPFGISKPDDQLSWEQCRRTADKPYQSNRIWYSKKANISFLLLEYHKNARPFFSEPVWLFLLNH